MLALADLSKPELLALHSRLAHLVSMVETFIPTTSVTGIVHHGKNLMTAIDERITVIESRRALRTSVTIGQTAEVK